MTDATPPNSTTLTEGLTAGRYLLLLLDLLEARGLNTAPLADTSGLSRASLEQGGSWIPSPQLASFLKSAEVLANDVHLGLALGRQLNLSAHGSTGFAGLTAANARDAIQVAVNYFPLVSGLLRLEVRENKTHRVIEIWPTASLPIQTERFLVEALIGSIDLMTTFMLAQHAPSFLIDLAFPEDPSVRDLLGSAITKLEFDKPGHAIHVPVHLLDIPFPLADAQAHRQALQRCDRELAALQRQRSFAALLRDQLMSADNQFPSIEQIADSMHVSSRTIHRRLKTEGTGFRELVNEARITRASWMLLREKRSVTETAHLLGYQDSANFTRAFRRHTGMSPSEYLRKYRT